MQLSHFFIRRPIFAGVIAIIITIVGLFAYFGLPVSQFPNVVPPTVTVSANYPGASAETVADTVAAPIEQQINGVDNMLYQSSQSTGDGRVTITVTFKLGTDLDTAQVLVQNRVALAQPSLPEEVRRQGVVVRKTSPSWLMAVNVLSPDGSLDRGYVSNYALTQLKDRLSRVDGIGDVSIFGARDYAMRVWIDPGRASTLGLTAGEVVDALRSQNVQVAAGTVGQPPFDTGAAQQLNVETQGRFKTADEFANIIIRTDPTGAITRLRDVARVELGAEDYGVNAYLSGKDSVILGITQRPGTNALAAAEGVKAQLAEASKTFPKGLEYRIIWNPTEFISESMTAVQETLLEAMLLVVLVIIVFLQSWRAAIIPIVAIPVSLIGSFAVLAALGYSLNTLSMFGLVLAIGIVVDDAIVVVENVERNLEHGLSPKEAAHRSMDEVSAALVAIVLVLCAVFVPVTFLTGITGEFYRQFAVTIAASTIISLLLSLTLSPALAARLLKPRSDHRAEAGVMGFVHRAGDWFNASFARLSEWYGSFTRRILNAPKRALTIYAGLVGLTLGIFWYTPSGFIPAQDQGYALAAIQLPPGSSIERTDAVLKKAVDKLLKVPGRRPGGDVLRLRRSVGDPGVQRRRGLCHVQAVRRAGRDRPHRAQHRERHARRARRHGRGVRVRHPAARHPGRRQRRRLSHDRPGPAGRRLPGARAGCPAADRPGAPGKGPRQRLHLVQHGDSARLRGRRPGEGRHARSAAGARVRSAAGLSRIGLRQRLQPARPNIPRDCPG